MKLMIMGFQNKIDRRKLAYGFVLIFLGMFASSCSIDSLKIESSSRGDALRFVSIGPLGSSPSGNSKDDDSSPVLGAFPENILFSEIPLLQETKLSFRIQNTSNVSLELTNPELPQPLTYASQGFWGAAFPGTNGTCSLTLNPGESCDAILSVPAMGATPHRYLVRWAYRIGTALFFSEVTLHLEPAPDTAIELSVNHAPELNVNLARSFQTGIDYELQVRNLPIHGINSLTLRIRNKTGFDFTIDTLNLQTADAALSFEAGQPQCSTQICEVSIQLSSDVISTAIGTSTFSIHYSLGSDERELHVKLLTSFIHEWASLEIDRLPNEGIDLVLGAGAIGQTIYRTFRITNSGAKPATFVAATLENNTLNFAIVSSTCLGSVPPVNGGCDIRISATPNAEAFGSATLRLSYFDGNLTQVKLYSLLVEGHNPSAADVVFIYNANDPESVASWNLYKQNRPGALNVRGRSLSLSTNAERISLTKFESEFINPLRTWFLGLSLVNRPRVLVMGLGIPSRVCLDSQCTNWDHGLTSVSHRIERALAEVGIQDGIRYRSVEGEFSPQLFPGTMVLVNYLNTGSLASTTAYFQKLAGMNLVGTTFLLKPPASATASKYFLEATVRQVEPIDVRWYFQLIRQELHSILNPLNVIYTEVFLGTPNWYLETILDGLKGIATMGSNGGRPAPYAIDGQMKLSNSSYSFFYSLESFNGHRTQGANIFGVVQSHFVDWFSPQAFGGANYSRTILCTATHVEEPTVMGIMPYRFMKDWERGASCGATAWANSPAYAMMVGDPYVTSRDPLAFVAP